MMDASTGNLVTSINNSVAGSAYAYDSQGDLLAYTVGNNHISCWNSTQASWAHIRRLALALEEWRPSATTVYNWPVGLEWNVSIAKRGLASLTP